MQLELMQFGQTLAVGAFAMLGLWLILKVFNKNILSTFLTGGNFEPIKIALNGIILAFLFSIGIILENYSKHVAAERNPPDINVRYVLGLNLEPDNETRFAALFKRESKNTASFLQKISGYRNCIVKCKRSSLYGRLDRENYFDLLASPIIGHQIQNLAEGISSSEFETISTGKKDSLLNVCSELYYNAKDRVYLETNYFQELSTISLRMDFLRAFILLTTIMFYLCFTTWIICWIFQLIKPDVERKKRMNRLFAFLMLSILLSCILPAAYTAECSNYNRRVFGYHLGLMKVEKIKEAKTEKKENCCDVNNVNIYNQTQNPVANKSRKPLRPVTKETCFKENEKIKELEAKIKKLESREQDLATNNKKSVKVKQVAKFMNDNKDD
jgi:hypothetical protein